jgi:hypothetical protein
MRSSRKSFDPPHQPERLESLEFQLTEFLLNSDLGQKRALAAAVELIMDEPGANLGDRALLLAACAAHILHKRGVKSPIIPLSVMGAIAILAFSRTPDDEPKPGFEKIPEDVFAQGKVKPGMRELNQVISRAIRDCAGA